MRLLITPLASAAIVAATALASLSVAAEPNNDHRRSMGNLRPDHRTAGPAIQGSPPPDTGQYHGWPHHRPFEYRPQYPHYRGLVPYYPGGYWYPEYRYLPDYGYDPYWPYASPPGYLGYPYVPALQIYAQRLNGLQAAQPVIGADQVRPAEANPPNVRRDGDEDAKDREEPAARATNQRAFNLGWRFIGFGDAHFSNEKYSDAYQRYKKAAQAAPGLADAHFRQAYALIALGNYQQAVRALKRGLELDPAWAGSDFRSDELYGNNQPAKKNHLDALTQASSENPNDADLLFVLGVFLHFDGQPDRAAPLFQRSARLSGGIDANLKGFLGQAEP